MKKDKNPGIQQVLLHGGLGNQLFQWAYGHRLFRAGQQVNYVFYKRSNSLMHASVSLGGFLTACDHGSFTEKTIPRYNPGRIILDPAHKLNIFRSAMGAIHSTLNVPFSDLDELPISKKGVHIGYFQSVNSVLKVEDIVISELWRVLERRKRTQLEIDLSGMEVIHIRQGDTLLPSNINKVGVLSQDYYKQIPYSKKRKRIVLTDDVQGAKKIFSRLPVDGIFGPSELDVYQTFGLMARAEVLHTANSTLSWWGGLLATSRGASVFLPNPFFRDYLPDPGLSFAHPAFNLIDAKFMLLDEDSPHGNTSHV